MIGLLLRKEAEEPLRALDLAIKKSPANVQGHDTHQIDLDSVLQEALLHAGTARNWMGTWVVCFLILFEPLSDSSSIYLQSQILSFD